MKNRKQFFNEFTREAVITITSIEGPHDGKLALNQWEDIAYRLITQTTALLKREINSWCNKITFYTTTLIRLPKLTVNWYKRKNQAITTKFKL